MSGHPKIRASLPLGSLLILSPAYLWVDLNQHIYPRASILHGEALIRELLDH